jgi:hypothetical protein
VHVCYLLNENHVNLNCRCCIGVILGLLGAIGVISRLVSVAVGLMTCAAKITLRILRVLRVIKGY